MTFLELAQAIDTAQAEIGQVATRLNAAKIAHEKEESSYLEATQKLADLFRQMQTMMGQTTPKPADDMKKVALDAQKYRTKM